MESEILQAFDKLSSSHEDVVYKGVVQLSELVKRSCSLGAPTGNTTKRKAFTSQLHTTQMKEFTRSQDCFSFNIASRLATSAVPKLHNEEYRKTALNTIEGLCLIHAPSRLAFASDTMLGLLIDQLEPTQPAKIQVAGINALVSVMVRQVENIRRFEQLKGLERICSLFKSKDTPKDVKVEILEFLFFYLIPETQVKENKPDRKTTEEKSQILGKYLSNVTGLVRELHTSTPFCDMDLEW